MKQWLLFSCFLALLSCSSEPGSSSGPATGKNEKQDIDSLPVHPDSIPAADSGSIVYERSTYDDPKHQTQIKSHREKLEALSTKNVFSAIHKNIISSIPVQQQAYFNSNPNYELLAVATGHLFLNTDSDFAFIVYDKKNQRISILVYNASADDYSELYRKLKVENQLADANCNYSKFGTLDFQIAADILDKSEVLLENPLSFLESSQCKITDLKKDPDFNLKSGCFSKKMPGTNLKNSLCISTSSVYQDWECLQYNKTRDSFIIYYGQAFAD